MLTSTDYYRSSRLRRVEKAVDRPINETIFNARDFKDSLKKKNHFLRTVLRGDKIMLNGSEDDLDAVARDAQSA